MGLTIYYELSTSLPDAEKIVILVEAVRQFALDLPFQFVSDLVQLAGDEESQDQDIENNHQWFKVQGTEYVGGNKVSPLQMIGFATLPGEGCESPNIGLCRYPDFTYRTSNDGRKRKVRTKLDGWRWGSYCKTQYASSPKVGGIENFLRCHLSIIKMLDFIKSTRVVTVNARDDGCYWESRSLEKLLKELADSNEVVAGLVGRLAPMLKKDGEVGAPIMNFPNFEHLEAKGAAKLDALWKSLGEKE